MSAAAAKRRAASGRRGGAALPDIDHASMHGGPAALGDDHAASRTSRSSCRNALRARCYPQILLKTLIEYDADNDGFIDDGEGETVPGTRDLIAEVPEPSTYAMALAGLACGGYSIWRRRKRA